MRFLGVVLALAFVVTGLAPTVARAQNQLEVGKDMSLATRQVSDWWMKVDYEPRDSRRGQPGGGELPPGLDRDVDTAVTGDAPGVASPVNPGDEMRIGTRKTDAIRFDLKQDALKTTGGLPPGIDRDTDASGTAVRNGLDLLGAQHRVPAPKADEAPRGAVVPSFDRVSPVSMSSGPNTPRAEAVRGSRGYKPNRFE